MKTADALMLDLVRFRSPVWSWRIEFRTKCQEKRHQSPRMTMFRTAKKGVERYRPFQGSRACPPSLTSWVDHTERCGMPRRSTRKRRKAIGRYEEKASATRRTTTLH